MPCFSRQTRLVRSRAALGLGINSLISILGAFQYAKSFGVKSLADETKPLGMDGPMWIASNTKLFTSVAAMQLIERGKITLDDDVSTLLPELAKLEVLTGFDEDDKPRLKKRQNTITLR